MKRIQDKWLMMAAAAAVGLMLVNIWLAYRNSRDLREHANLVDHTYQVIGSMQGLMSRLVDAETGQRGFVITGKESYLEPYLAALPKIDAEIEQVQRLTEDNPTQQARMATLRQRVADRIKTLEENVARRRQDDVEGAREAILSGRGKTQMDAVRRLIDEMLKDEDALLNERSAQADATFNRSIATELLSGLCALAAIGVLLISVWQNLSARAKATSRLAEQRELLQTTLSSIGDAVITTDNDARVTYLNTVAQQLTGWTQADARGQPLEAVFHIVNESTRHTVENPAQRALREGVIVGLANHTVLIAKDGAERPIDDSAAPIRGDSTEVSGCVLVFRDVSERQAADRALRLSAGHKAAVLETALDCIISMDHRGLVTEWNPAAEQAFGYARDAAIGQELAELIIPTASRDAHKQGLARFLATGEGPVIGRRLELAAVRSDGVEMPVEVAITRLPGDPPSFTAHLRDITERLQSATELRESEAKYRTLVEQVKDYAIFRINPEGRPTTWNAGVKSVLGFEEAEFVGQDVISLIFTPEDQASGVADQELETAARKGSASDDRWMIKKDGTRFWAAGVTESLRDAEGRLLGFTKVMRDRTDAKRMEDDLRQFAAELSEADRRKNEFLAMLAHELRNPLAPIRNALEILRRSEGSADQTAQATAMMQRQVSQMVRLIDDLLDVSRVSRGAIELRIGQVDLVSVVNDSLAAARTSAQSQGVELVADVPTEPIYLDADTTRVSQIVGNLLSNACKFTNSGGRVQLELKREAGSAVIRIVDTGVGISAEQLPHIFDMFMQADTSLERTQSGLGIGLTLVKRLVEMHGGSVQAASAGLGHGSEFTVRLPLSATQAATTSGTAGGGATSVSGRRILVVDDNRDSAQSLAMLLKLSKNDVHQAHDGEAALAAAALLRPEAILLDIGLPKLNGYEVARQIRNQPWGEKIVLVALTGWGQDEDRAQSRAVGFNGHLVKPVDHTALMRILADSLSEV